MLEKGRRYHKYFSSLFSLLIFHYLWSQKNKQFTPSRTFLLKALQPILKYYRFIRVLVLIKTILGQKVKV